MADPVGSFRYGDDASYEEADPLMQILPAPAADYEDAAPLPLKARVGFANDQGPIFFTRADAGSDAEQQLLRASKPA
ncbi:hypothetical protein LQ954_09105 [Sphingomonas sp. IC-11]|uniref:hypothetical protein n=1 Tax=Sphingomonas sp. IC-11 TaxID=2898528 RepID=UPI001E3AE395|nr:hypothetical protein [Sphingomonas sp. IC-11]MCD2316306.1 hypothetical protein [Sphingomonas sp. IC-11]